MTAAQARRQAARHEFRQGLLAALAVALLAAAVFCLVPVAQAGPPAAMGTTLRSPDTPAQTPAQTPAADPDAAPRALQIGDLHAPC